MSQLVWAVRIGGVGMLMRVGSQQVARRNAATAAAALLRRREKREAVDAYLASRTEIGLHAGTRPDGRAGAAS
jgi:hypothetical protein